MLDQLSTAIKTLAKIQKEFNETNPNQRSWLSLPNIDYTLEENSHQRTIIALVPECFTESPDAINSTDPQDLIDEYYDFYGVKPANRSDLWNDNLMIKIFFQDLDTASESCETLEDYLGELKDQIDDLMSYYVN